ncbi:MAG TPA: flagellar hook protein FlgE [Stellaceae bacterium]|nr:flagellar hook protein FlgE [Stellaceae bacterium]
MSVFGALTSAVSGLLANSQSLSMISDNISNADTVGYKDTQAQFSTLVTQAPTSTLYTPGGVETTPVSNIGVQGLLQSESSPTDLAIQGGGFFVVNKAAAGAAVNGQFSFTRAGAFSVDANGNLVNTAGLFLQGQKLTAAQAQAILAGNVQQLSTTSLATLQTVNISDLSGTAQATQNVTLAANLPAGDTPTSPARTMTVPVFDSLGNEHNLTLNFSRAVATPATPSTSDFGVPNGAVDGDTVSITIDGTTLSTPVTDPGGTGAALTANDVAAALQTQLNGSSLTGLTATVVGGNVQITDPSGNALTVTNFTDSTAGAFTAAGTTAGTPAVAAPNKWTVTGTLSGAGNSTVTIANGDNIVQFNSDGTLNAGASTFDTPDALTVNWDPNVTGGTSPQTLSFNLGSNGQTNGLSQFGGPYTVSSINQDGLTVGSFTSVSIDQNGVVTATFSNGQREPIYIIPVATFKNPDGLQAQTGNTYLETQQSGNFVLSQSGTGAAGTITPSALEDSTVDIATEFSNLIITQRAYEANAKIITTADQMLEDLIQAKQ